MKLAQHIDRVVNRSRAFYCKEERNAFLVVSCQDRADVEDIVASVWDRSKPL
jgi:hypothetical protein